MSYIRGKRDNFVSAEEMNKRITIKSPPTNKNAFGEIVGPWVDVITVWSAMDPLLGNEYFNALAIQSEVEVKFRIRYRPGITNEMRVQHGTTVYEILSAINVKSMNRELLIYCKVAVVV